MILNPCSIRSVIGKYSPVTTPNAPSRAAYDINALNKVLSAVAAAYTAIDPITRPLTLAMLLL